MNIALSIIMCSLVYAECMPPYEFPERYRSHYECMIAGYEKSLSKMKEIGKRTLIEINCFLNLLAMKKNESPI